MAVLETVVVVAVPGTAAAPAVVPGTAAVVAVVPGTAAAVAVAPGTVAVVEVAVAALGTVVVAAVAVLGTVVEGAVLHAPDVHQHLPGLEQKKKKKHCQYLDLCLPEQKTIYQYK